MAPGQGVPAREARHGPLDDAQGGAAVHDGGVAGACAGAGPHIHGTGVPHLHRDEATHTDDHRPPHLRLRHPRNPRGRGREGRPAQPWHNLETPAGARPRQLPRHRPRPLQSRGFRGDGCGRTAPQAGSVHLHLHRAHRPRQGHGRARRGFREAVSEAPGREAGAGGTVRGQPRPHFDRCAPRHRLLPRHRGGGAAG